MIIIILLQVTWVLLGNPIPVAQHLDEVPLEVHTEPESLTFHAMASQWERNIMEEYFAGITGSRDITRAVMTYCDEFQIPYTLAFALVKKESSFNPFDLSYNETSVDRGLFQLNSQSFPFLTTDECFDPWISAEYGLGYLRYCWDRGGNQTIALAMYNAGPTRVENQGTPAFTVNYIHRIYQFQDEFEREIAQRMAFDPQILEDAEKTVKIYRALMDQKEDIN